MAAVEEGAPLEFSTQTRLLVVAPHPDDETIATGVLIQQVLAAGGEVRIVLLTNGDNNPWPQRWLERRFQIGPAERQRWGTRRRAEMLQALACLGVPSEALHAFGWPDMGLAGLVMDATATAVEAMAAEIRQFAPTLIAMPALDDRHPDHGSTHVLVRLALAGITVSPRLWTYVVHGAIPAGRLLEIAGSHAQQANKQRALAMHRSQMVLSAKRMRALADRPERYVEIDPASHPAPSGLPWQPTALWRHRLRLGVVSPAGAASWRWHEAPLQQDASGRVGVTVPAETMPAPVFARLASDLPSFWIFDRWGWCQLR